MNILLGDIHGNLKVLFKYIQRGYASGGCIYQIGDFGIYNPEGEEGSYDRNILHEDLEDLDKRLVEQDTKLKVIRGNHDNPKYWNNDEIRNLFNKTYNNIELLPDYHIEVIEDQTCLFIGGSVSIDRVRRVEGLDWWADEIVQLPEGGIESLPEVDVVIAHNCPSYFNLTSDSNSIKTMWGVADENLVEDLDTERLILDDVMAQVKPERWFSGHYHNHLMGERDGCSYRCININELFAITPNKPFKNI